MEQNINTATEADLIQSDRSQADKGCMRQQRQPLHTVRGNDSLAHLWSLCTHWELYQHGCRYDAYYLEATYLIDMQSS